MVRRASFHLTGTVQGVNLRHLLRLQSLQHGLRGWARNEADGSVTVEIEGDRAEVQRVYDWLLASPGRSRITDVRMEWMAPRMDEPGFTVIP
jgi:acylphosphatase